MKTKLKYFLLLSAYCSLFTVHAVTNYVWQSSPTPISPYTNWTTAANVIQDAVDAANGGDLVLVTNGFYTTGGGLTPGFSLSNRVVITKSITLQSVNGPTNTLIVGQGPMGSNAVRCAYLTNGAEIIGFTLTNGHTRNDGEWPYDRSGGGGLLNNGGLLSNCHILANSIVGVICTSNGEVRNCLVNKNSSTGIAGQGNFIVDTCIVNENTGNGISAYDGGIINNCYISENSGKGVYLNTSSIDGFINNCIISNNYYNVGGAGVFFQNGGIAVDCLIIDNVTSNFGGGVHFGEGGSIYNCEIIGNIGKSGGGIHCYKKGIINDSIITENFATEYGGGVYLNSGGIVSNCTISGNSAGDGINTAGNGGGVYLLNGGIVNNCVIKENTIYSMLDLTDVGFGGGAYSSGGGTLNNCLISDNDAIYPGSEVGGVYGGTLNNCTVVNNYGREGCGGTSGGAVRNSIVFGNYNQFFEDNYCGGTYEYSCSTPLPAGEGNIPNNPMFEFASTGNYHLFFGSPCINSGTNAYVVGDRDLDGNPRIVGGRVDMGCYEVPIPEMSVIGYQLSVISLIFFNLIWRKL